MDLRVQWLRGLWPIITENPNKPKEREWKRRDAGKLGAPSWSNRVTLIMMKVMEMTKNRIT